MADTFPKDINAGRDGIRYTIKRLGGLRQTMKCLWIRQPQVYMCLMGMFVLAPGVVATYAGLTHLFRKGWVSAITNVYPIPVRYEDCDGKPPGFGGIQK